MFFKRLPWETTITETVPKNKHVESEFAGTYIEVFASTPMNELIAIQDWIKEQPGLKIASMPVADISTLAGRNGNCFVLIDIAGYVNYGRGFHPEFRKLSFHIYPKVSSYTLEPAEVEVLGKRYNKKELEEALAALETK